MAKTFKVMVESKRILTLRLPVEMSDGRITTAKHQVAAGTFPIYCRTNSPRVAARAFNRRARRFGAGVRLLGKTFCEVGA